MTRIFDALRKVQAVEAPAVIAPPAYHAPPVHAPPPPLHVAPARHVPAARPDGWAPPRVAAAGRIESVGVGELPDDLVRELTTLRIGIESIVEDRAPRVILFTSSQGGEGTSTVAAEFAALLAGDPGTRTLLVETHARRPSLAARFAMEDGVPPARSADDNGSATLSVMPLPSEFERRGMFPPSTLRELLGTAAGAWDWVIIDGPPVLESPEATELATLAAGVVIVVQAGSTKRHVVTRAVDLLRKAGARVLGSVLNRRRLEIPDFLYRRI